MPWLETRLEDHIPWLDRTSASLAICDDRRVTPFTLFVWLLTCLIWSTVWLFIKLGVTDVPPVTFAAYRLLTALLVLAPITLTRRIPLPRDRRDWMLIAGTGVLLLGAITRSCTGACSSCRRA
jgi:drug/metabolite transporter (DMT)-like permease